MYLREYREILRNIFDQFVVLFHLLEIHRRPLRLQYLQEPLVLHPNLVQLLPLLRLCMASSEVAVLDFVLVLVFLEYAGIASFNFETIDRYDFA